MPTTNLDLTRKFKEFTPPPSQDIRERYTYRTETKSNGEGKWPYTVVVVERHNEDGTTDDVYSYTRNYSMMKTFEPFRQFRDGEWKEYALISSEYVRFEVLDLQTGQVIAKEPYPKVTEEHHERWTKLGHPEWCEQNPIGTEKPGWGFCPVEFYVPDWFEEYDLESPYLTFSSRNSEDDAPRFLYSEEDLMSLTGRFALYTGCVWGDDFGGWKVRYIDLSCISEGIVTSDDRFGYIQFAGESLKESVQLWDGAKRVTLPVELVAELDTGKAFKVEANWKD